MTNHRTRLASLAVLALAPLVTLHSSPASAAGGTCEGLTPTIHGEPGQKVTGTNGPDVIVSDGSYYVNGLGGDDVICISGIVEKRTTEITIVAGDGNDTVDTTKSPVRTSTDLGKGDDTFVGGDMDDDVKAAGSGTDTISTAGGNDIVTTGNGTDATNADSINLGDGDDTLTVTGGVSSGTWDGGDGTDSMTLAGGNGSGDWTVDNATGTASRAGGNVATWSSFEHFDLSGIKATDLTFDGSAADEYVTVGETYRLPGTIHLDPAGGDDTLELDAIDDYDIVGGPGINTLVINNQDRGNALKVDLAEGKIYFPTSVSTETGIRNVTTDGFGTTRLFGNKLGNRLIAHHPYTLVEIDGRDGDDYLQSDFSHSSRMDGGNGNDHFLGTEDNDLLIGGAGRDSADARNGSDTCQQIEVRTSCEKH